MACTVTHNIPTHTHTHTHTHSLTHSHGVHCCEFLPGPSACGARKKIKWGAQSQGDRGGWRRGRGRRGRGGREEGGEREWGARRPGDR